MMSKSEALEALEMARRSHIKWVNRAKSMVDGGVEKYVIPIL